MELPPALLQFFGSLAAILALAGLARWLKLGAAPRLTSEAQAREAADEAVSGFDPVAIDLDSKGRAAIMRDGDGRLLLLRQHGSHFAGRLLTPRSRMTVEDGELVIDSGERRYGSVRLALDDASAWVQALEAIRTGQHA